MSKKIKPDESYISRSARAVFLWSFFTLGIYQLYWSYRHWKEIGQRDGRNTHPFWATVFFLFTLYPLLSNFKRQHIKDSHQFNPGLMTILYIAFYIILNVPGYALEPGVGLLVSGLASALLTASFLGYIQSQLNATLPKDVKRKKYSAPEIVWIVFGMLFFVPGILSTLIPSESLSTPVLTAEQQVQAAQLNAKSESLLAEYDGCMVDADRYAGELPENYSQEDWDKSVKWYEKCEAVRIEQNKAVEDYNKLTLGFWSFLSE